MDNIDLLVDAKKKPSKTIYWILIQKRFPVKEQHKTIWQVNLSTEIDQEMWQNLFPEFLQIVSPTKLHRLLSNSLTTNVIRHK